MQRFQTTLLGVWSTACRHLHIEDTVGDLAVLLQADLPLKQMAIYRIDGVRSCAELVAGHPELVEGDQAAVNHACSPTELKRLLAWCRRGELMQIAAGIRRESWWDSVLGTRDDSARLIGPLVVQGQPLGIVVFAAHDGKAWTERHRSLIRVLLEPLAVALENGERLREIARLKEAAEANTRMLLNKLGREQLDETIVGTQTGLRAVMQRVELVAKSDVPVLLFGETGTGKELVARAIHQRSPRSSGPILRVNCGAIPAELIDSELFGHERGAFTGAVDQRKGWFERADGGTLFLDEIGELSLAAQVRLLRVLQDGWLHRVGSQHPVNVDVRIVCATHRDLQAMVAQSQFREDLWYRLAVFPIVLPPLRERLDDIPALARHFAQRAAKRFGLASVEPRPADLEILQAYDWPGNIRELASVIDRAAILGEGGTLEVARAIGILKPTVRAAASFAASPSPPAAVAESIAPLDDVMKRHIERTLTITGGRVEGPFGAAVRLQINPHTLRARMRKLGVDWRRFRQG